MERRKCGGKRRIPPHLQADRRGDHLLLRDVHFEVAIGKGTAEIFGVGGVAHFAVQRDHIRAGGAQCFERITVGAAGGHALSDTVDGHLHRLCGRARRPGRVGAADLHSQVPLTAELRDGLDGLLFGHGLAVPAFLVLDQAAALALDGPGDDHRRDAGRSFRLRIRPLDLLQVVAVDLECPPPKGLRLLCVGAGVPSQHRFASLAQTVHVHDADQVRELVVRGVLDRLPHRPFGHLAIAGEHPHTIGKLIQILTGQRDSHADGQPLPERPRGHVHPRQDRGGMPLEPAAELAQGHHLYIGNRAGGLEYRVEERRGMPFREHQVIVTRILGIGEVVTQVIGQQDRHQVGGRHRRGGMAGARLRGGPDTVHTQLRREFAPELWSCHRVLIQPRLSLSPPPCREPTRIPLPPDPGPPRPASHT